MQKQSTSRTKPKVFKNRCTLTIILALYRNSSVLQKKFQVCHEHQKGEDHYHKHFNTLVNKNRPEDKFSLLPSLNANTKQDKQHNSRVLDCNCPTHRILLHLRTVR